jgi:hypothetical protein
MFSNDSEGDWISTENGESYSTTELGYQTENERNTEDKMQSASKLLTLNGPMQQKLNFIGSSGVNLQHDIKMSGLHLNLATLPPGYETSTSLISWICPKLSGYSGKRKNL